LLDEIKFPFYQKKYLCGTHKHIAKLKQQFDRIFLLKNCYAIPILQTTAKKNSLKLVAAAHGDVGAADAGVADGSRVTAASGLRITFVNP
jgi:hypothetical protein